MVVILGFIGFRDVDGEWHNSDVRVLVAGEVECESEYASVAFLIMFRRVRVCSCGWCRRTE